MRNWNCRDEEYSAELPNKEIARNEKKDKADGRSFLTGCYLLVAVGDVLRVAICGAALTCRGCVQPRVRYLAEADLLRGQYLQQQAAAELKAAPQGHVSRSLALAADAAFAAVTSDPLQHTTLLEAVLCKSEYAERSQQCMGGRKRCLVGFNLRPRFLEVEVEQVPARPALDLLPGLVAD